VFIFCAWPTTDGHSAIFFNWRLTDSCSWRRNKYEIRQICPISYLQVYTTISAHSDVLRQYSTAIKPTVLGTQCLAPTLPTVGSGLYDSTTTTVYGAAYLPTTLPTVPGILVGPRTSIGLPYIHSLTLRRPQYSFAWPTANSTGQRYQPTVAHTGHLGHYYSTLSTAVYGTV